MLADECAFKSRLVSLSLSPSPAFQSDEIARMQYMATFHNPNEPLECISKMGTDVRVARSATIIYCGFCCKPFSCAGKGLGFDDERYGDNFALLAQAMRQRRDEQGLWDPCLICENVPTLLNHLGLEHLERLGYYCKIYIVSGSQFRCASARQRLVLVGFREKAALERFTPPRPQATAPTPLRTVLKKYSSKVGQELFLTTGKFTIASERSHVVGPNYPMGARSPTSSYGSLQTPGTLLCLAEEHQQRETPLSAAEVKRLHAGGLRKLHPTEQLASFSFEPHEYPQFKGALNEQYKSVAQTICLNVFEAFTAEALAALGKPGVRDKLYAQLDGMGITAHRGGDAGGNAHACDGGTDAAALPAWLEARVSKCGVPFHKYAPLREADDPEDDLSEYEKANHANIEANRKKLEELGLL